MKWRIYGNEIFSSNRLGKGIMLFFQLFFWWQYCNFTNFTPQHNIFTTYQLVGVQGIMGNLAWILYYLGGEFYLLTSLQEKFLVANPLVVVRNEKRTTILQNCFLTTIVFAFLYNLFFLGMLAIFTRGNITLLFSLRLFASLCLSLTAFTLLLLLASVVEPILGWIMGIIVVIACLALKTNYLMLLTTKVTWVSTLSNCGWLLILGLLLNQINKNIETK